MAGRSPGMTRGRPSAHNEGNIGAMTFDDIRKIALAWPEVEDGTSYGTPALKVRKKMLARLKEDGDSLVMPGVPPDERDMLVESQPRMFLLHRSLQRLSDGADPAVED